MRRPPRFLVAFLLLSREIAQTLPPAGDDCAQTSEVGRGGVLAPSPSFVVQHAAQRSPRSPPYVVQHAAGRNRLGGVPPFTARDSRGPDYSQISITLGVHFW